MFLGGNSTSNDKKSGSFSKSPNPDQRSFDKWAAALTSLDSSSLVKYMVDEVAKVPYKKKRELGRFLVYALEPLPLL
jgi:hypothetical protein